MELLFLILMLGLMFGDDKTKSSAKKRKRSRSWWRSPSYSEYDRWWHDNPSNKGGWN